MTCPVFGVHYISHASGKEFTINDPEVIEHLFDYAFDPIAFDYIIKKLTKNYGVDREIIFHLMSDHASAQGWVHMTLEDFFAQPHAPLSWVVDGVFTQIGASIISSPPKAGKTTLMRWLAYCVATGREWLQRKTQKTPVLYVGNEENRAALYESLATFKNVFGPVDPKHFYLSFGIPIKRLFLQFMEERLKDGYRFIILDPVVDCVPLLNANDYAQVNTALKPLRTLAMRYGAHILCVHHANRHGTGTNAFLGSQAFRGFSDCNLRIEGEEDEPRYLFSENRISSRHGGFIFKGAHLIESPVDGSIFIGNSKPVTEHLKQLLRMVEAIGALIMLLLTRSQEKWNVTNVRKELGGDNNYLKDVISKAVSVGVVCPLPEKGEKVLKLTPEFLGCDPETLHEKITDAFTKVRFSSEEMTQVLEHLKEDQKGL